MKLEKFGFNALQDIFVALVLIVLFFLICHYVKGYKDDVKTEFSLKEKLERDLK